MSVRVTICSHLKVVRAYRMISKLKFGDERGAFSKGATEALTNWILLEGPKYLGDDFDLDIDYDELIGCGESDRQDVPFR